MGRIKPTDDRRGSQAPRAAWVAAMLAFVVVLGAILVLTLVVLRPPATTASIHQVLERVRADYWQVYDADQAFGTADDLTPAKLDLILTASPSGDASTDVRMMRLLTTTILNLVASELGQATDAVPICRGGQVDVSSVEGASELFGGTRLEIGRIVADVVGSWTGTLSSDPREWTFGYERSQAPVVASVLRDMAEGRSIIASGC